MMGCDYGLADYEVRDRRARHRADPAEDFGGPELARRLEVIRDAEAAGHRVVYGHDRVLQLDIDDDESLARAEDAIQRLRRVLGVERVSQTISTGGNWHLYVYLAAPLPRLERLLMQGLLGSDPIREALNWDWARRGNDGECFLIECNAEEDFGPFEGPDGSAVGYNE